MSPTSPTSSPARLPIPLPARAGMRRPARRRRLGGERGASRLRRAERRAAPAQHACKGATAAGLDIELDPGGPQPLDQFACGLGRIADVVGGPAPLAEKRRATITTIRCGLRGSSPASRPLRVRRDHAVADAGPRATRTGRSAARITLRETLLPNRRRREPSTTRRAPRRRANSTSRRAGGPSSSSPLAATPACSAAASAAPSARFAAAIRRRDDAGSRARPEARTGRGERRRRRPARRAGQPSRWPSGPPPRARGRVDGGDERSVVPFLSPRRAVPRERAGRARRCEVAGCGSSGCDHFTVSFDGRSSTASASL